MHMKLLGRDVEGQLESAEQAGPGKIRLTVNTGRFGKFVIMITEDERVKIASPTTAPAKRTA